MAAAEFRSGVAGDEGTGAAGLDGASQGQVVGPDMAARQAKQASLEGIRASGAVNVQGAATLCIEVAAEDGRFWGRVVVRIRGGAGGADDDATTTGHGVHVSGKAHADPAIGSVDSAVIVSREAVIETPDDDLGAQPYVAA